MDIFESLENLEVSEGCFDEIMGLVEEILSEDTVSYAKKLIRKNKEAKNSAKSLDDYNTAKDNIKRLEDLADKADDLQREANRGRWDHQLSANTKGRRKHMRNQEDRNQAKYEADPENYSHRSTWAEDIKDEHKHTNYDKLINDMRVTKSKIRNEKKQYKKTKDPNVIKTKLEYPSKYGYNPDAGADYGYGD